MEGEKTSTTNCIEREGRDKRGVLNEKQFLKIALEKKEALRHFGEAFVLQH